MKIINIMLSRDLGGVQQSFLDYDKMLKQEKLEVVNITSIGAEINDLIKRDYTLLNMGSWDWLSILRLKSILKKEQPDVIIAHGGRATKFAYYAKDKTPMIGITHSGKLKWVDKCDYIIVLTSAMKKKAMQEGIDQARLVMIPNTVDTSIFSRKEKEETSLPVIGTMARFVPKKGIDTLLESIAILAKEGLQFKVIIGGGGDEEAAYRLLSKTLGLEHYVEFTGWVRDKEQFFERLDIFCLPSHNEPFGIILLEAMAYKMPIVSTKTEGPLDILTHNSDALLVDIGSQLQMAEAIKKLLDDEILAKSLANQASIRVQKDYDIKIVGKKLLSLLNKIKK